MVADTGSDSPFVVLSVEWFGAVSADGASFSAASGVGSRIVFSFSDPSDLRTPLRLFLDGALLFEVDETFLDLGGLVGCVFSCVFCALLAVGLLIRERKLSVG